MPPITHIFVTAAPGREVPFPQGEASGPGGMLLKALPGKVYRAAYSSTQRRAIAKGDLIMVNQHGRQVRELEQANATESQAETDETGAIAGVETVTTEGSSSEMVTADAPSRDFSTRSIPPRKV